jgi:hypothetical protein
MPTVEATAECWSCRMPAAIVQPWSCPVCGLVGFAQLCASCLIRIVNYELVAHCEQCARFGRPYQRLTLVVN